MAFWIPLRDAKLCPQVFLFFGENYTEIRAIKPACLIGEHHLVPESLPDDSGHHLPQETVFPFVKKKKRGRNLMSKVSPFGCMRSSSLGKSNITTDALKERHVICLFQ